MSAVEASKKAWARLAPLMQSKLARRLIYAVLLLAGAAFLAVSVYGNWNELRDQNWQVDWRFIALALLLYPAGMLPTVAAWHNLLHAMQQPFPFRTNLRLYSLSSLPRHIPGLVMFVASRSMLYGEVGVSSAISVAATALETVLLAATGFVASLLLLLSRSQALQNFQAIRYAGPVAALLLLLALAAIPFAHRSLQKRLEKAGRRQIPPLDRNRLGIALAWMFAAWAGGGLILFSLANALQPVGWALLPAAIGTWGAAGAVSLTVGIGIQGLGIREVTVSALLSLFLPPLLAVVLAIAFRLVLTAGEVIWVLIFIWITRKE